ncbi:MAG: SRPBCC family protein [Verrucomicrobiota bacterium]
MPALTVQKSISINAPVEKVYLIVRDFKQWPVWSPWLSSEPDCSLEYADDGKSYQWDGKIIGSGSLKVTEEEKNQNIGYRLEMLTPWKSASDVQMTFVPQEQGVEVTWSMQGSLPIFLFFMQKMMTSIIGSDYERGLRMLKDYIELGAVPSKMEMLGEQEVSALRYIGIKRSVLIDQVEKAMEADLKALVDLHKEKKIAHCGPPLSIYHKWDLKNSATEYTIAFPVLDLPDSLPDIFTIGEIPAHRAYQIKHIGPYRHLGNAWSAGMARKQAKYFRMAKAPDMFEIYLNSPQEVQESELESLLHFPLK